MPRVVYSTTTSCQTRNNERRRRKKKGHDLNLLCNLQFWRPSGV